MSSQDQGKTDGGGGPSSPHKPATKKKPSVAEIHNRLLEFSRQNPDMKFTTQDFANALREVARRKQAAELMTNMTGVSVDITSPQLQSTEPKAASSSSHDQTTQDKLAQYYRLVAPGQSASAPATSTNFGPTNLDANQPISIRDNDGRQFGFLMKQQDVDRIAQSPRIGSAGMPTKPNSAPPRLDSVEATGSVDAGSGASSDPDAKPTLSPGQVVVSMRPRGDPAGPSATTSSPARALVANLGFAAASSAAGNRKAPPPALNLPQPSRPAAKPKPAANHYISMVAKTATDMQPENMEKVEATMNWGKSPAQQVVMLKSPVATLFWENKKKEKGLPSIMQYSVDPIPQTHQKTNDQSNDYTLETPLTAKFAKEQDKTKKEEQAKNEEAASIYQPDVNALFENHKPDDAASKSEKGKKPGDAASKDKKGKKATKRTLRRRAANGIPQSYRIHLALTTGRSRPSKRFDMLEQLSANLGLIVEVCKHLPPADLLNLYSVHRTFHEAVNRFLRSSIRTWTDYNCPEAALVYNWRSAMYRHLTIPDPAGRPLASPLTPFGFHPYRPKNNVYKPSTSSDNAYLESQGIDTSKRKGKEKMVYSDDNTKADDQGSSEGGDHEMIRLVPTLKWYAMCYKRQEAAEDILAHLARHGHRTPPGTSTSLLKLWKLLATPTNDGRRAIIRSEARNNHNMDCKCWILKAKARLDRGLAVPLLKNLERMARIGALGLPEAVQGFTDLDLARLQCFFLKLDLRFNDPIYGPECTDLSDLMLGQRSLEPLRQLLFGERYRTIDQLIALKIRYDLGCAWTVVPPAPDEVLFRQNWKLMGVPFADWGKTHLEYWGERSGGPLSSICDPRDPTVNRNHMIHVTQLVAEESKRRDLKLEQHLIPLTLWGCIDWKTGQNLHPTESEIYMHDSAHKNRLIDTSQEFTRIEILKGRWYSLSTAERQEVLDAQLKRDDLLRKWDNNHMWNPQKPTDQDEEATAISHAVMQPITGLTAPPEIPRIDADALLGNVADDSVETPGSLSAELMELERMDYSDFNSDSDSDSEHGLGSFEEDESPSSGAGGENDWKPKTPDNCDQLPQSFKQSVAEYQRRKARATTSSPSFTDGLPMMPHGRTDPTPIPGNGVGDGGAGPAGPAGHDDPIMDQNYINNVLYDMEEQLSDSDESIGYDDSWDYFDWEVAPRYIWSFLDHVRGDGSEETDEEDAGPSNSNSANAEEETVESAWAALQEAEAAAIAAGYRHIQARDDGDD
ncbi:uncharacterized protein PG986_000612 [Apiospora aurea]|uniref:F-box domain-containing protein n=1 Tax=Apiospora aurea TaxID=335848 RepID=A0ABR1QUJ9_9PEZI